MQIKRRNTPTIQGVSRKMRAFEFRYRISTDDFLREGSESNVSEDDATQWRYLREQLSALQAAAIRHLYANSPVGQEARLKNCEDSSKLALAA